MLCQHLGFEDTAVISTAQLYGRRQIATGDLICYKTQSSETSCCVHLQPSTTTSSITLPYVRCKYKVNAGSRHKISYMHAFNLFLISLHGLVQK